MRAAALLLLVCTAALAAGPDARLAPGSGSFVLLTRSMGADREIRVWYHRPEHVAADAPVVFVMHGVGRNAQSYRRAWIPHANARGFVLLVPEYSRAQFGGDYNLERLRYRDGSRIPPQEWPYAAIERIFDLVRVANGMTARSYDIYGHSAGAQFVHRLVLLMPQARYRVAVAANAGWYTMPDDAIAYPYGLGGLDMPPAVLAHTLARHLVVLLGDEDMDPDHPDLRRTPQAMAQGENRFARGLAFFERARQAAVRTGARFAWQVELVPGVAHSNRGMAAHAALLVGARGDE